MDNIKSEMNKALDEHIIDLLVNNAGNIHFHIIIHQVLIIVGMNVLAPFLEAKEEDWDTVMNVNLKSTFIISQVCLQFCD